MQKLFVGIIILICVIGCKTISINQESLILTKTPVELGTIGLLEGSVVAYTYENITTPSFHKALKLNIQPVSFTKQTFKAFSKANKQEKVALTFSDSLKTKPEYIVLQLMDRVEMTTALNNSRNEGVRMYLENKKDAQMVTSISATFSAKDTEALKNAEEVFLVQSPSKKMSLQLKNTDGTKRELLFSQSVIFAYQTSSFCWKENDRHELVIADIISGSESCPPNTYRKSHKAIEKNDYFKL